MTLQFDRGPISAAAMRYLDTRRDLGIHTAILTDDILRLIRSGAITNQMKAVNKGKTVATMAMGTTELYAEIASNPHIELLPIDQVSNPQIIAQNDHMVSIHTVEEMELTGMARANTTQRSLQRSLPTSMNFIDGARHSKDGFTILALRSTTPDGKRSNIVSVSLGRGVAFSRAEIDYVVTEYGVVNLCGLPVRERAIALISVAHPKFRHQLLEEAKKLKYVTDDQVIPPEAGCVYPHQYEFTKVFRDGTEVRFRPLQPSDAHRLQKLFYSLSRDTIRHRYHGTIKTLTDAAAQRQAAIDYSKDMAIVGLVGPWRNPLIVGEGRYSYDPDNNMGEFDIVVREDYRGCGIGTFLANYLGRVAYARGLAGVYADVIPENAATMSLLRRAWPTAERSFDSGTCVFTFRFPQEAIERPKDSILGALRRLYVRRRAPVRSGTRAEHAQTDPAGGIPRRALDANRGAQGNHKETPHRITRTRVHRCARGCRDGRDTGTFCKVQPWDGRLPNLSRNVRLRAPVFFGDNHRCRSNHQGKCQCRL
jgi:GNAT superfamily N-acetyltransferase